MRHMAGQAPQTRLDSDRPRSLPGPGGGFSLGGVKDPTFITTDDQRLLEAACVPVSRTQIHHLFANHMPVAAINRVLQDLFVAGRVERWFEPTGGRPREMWRATP
jgi:hypothetical protein